MLTILCTVTQEEFPKQAVVPLACSFEKTLAKLHLFLNWLATSSCCEQRGLLRVGTSRECCSFIAPLRELLSQFRAHGSDVKIRPRNTTIQKQQPCALEVFNFRPLLPHTNDVTAMNTIQRTDFHVPQQPFPQQTRCEGSENHFNTTHVGENGRTPSERHRKRVGVNTLGIATWF